MKKNNTYLCPYSFGVKCDMTKPCLGCYHMEERKEDVALYQNGVKKKIKNLIDSLKWSGAHVNVELLIESLEDIYK